MVRRVVVVGGPGAGKTSVAARLATVLGCRHVELDGLWWQPGWRPVDADTFADRLRVVAAADAWVADGNYFDVGATDVLWAAADTLIWLDPPRRVAVARVVRRTARRVARRELLWGSNRQSVGDLSPRSITRLVRTWPAYTTRIAALVAAREHDLDIAHVRSRSDLHALLSHPVGDRGAGTRPPDRRRPQSAWF